MKENGLKSIAFQVINSEKRGYPPENGAHIAIRTVRRFLEKYGQSLDLIVFCMDRDEDIVLYSSILPLYFPRSSEEESKVMSLLPEDTGNENGETVIEERKIRIAATPIVSSVEAAAVVEPSTLNQAREEMPDDSSSAGRFLASMQGDPDVQKVRHSAHSPNVCTARSSSHPPLHSCRAGRRTPRVRTSACTARCCGGRRRRTWRTSCGCSTSTRAAATEGGTSWCGWAPTRRGRTRSGR